MGVMDDTAVTVRALVVALNQIQKEVKAEQARVNAACEQLLGELGATGDPQVLRVARFTVDAVQRLTEAASHLRSAVANTTAFAAELGLSPPGKASTRLETVPVDRSLARRSEPGTSSNAATGETVPDQDHFNAVAPGYERVERENLPEDWMRTTSRGFQRRPAGAG